MARGLIIFGFGYCANNLLQNSNGYSRELFLYGDPMHLSNKGHRIVSNFILLNIENYDK